jgi:xylulokinase
MTLVAGVDSSTQSCKVVVCEAESGEVVRTGSAPHPEGSEVDPQAWAEALDRASSGLLDGVSTLSVAGQQHGMVALDEDGEVVRPALLWNDTRSAQATRDLVAELGAEEWARSTGTLPVPSLTVTKLRWMAENEPDAARRTERVLLPHDWLTWRATGRREAVTDRGDASGTGYWSPFTGSYLPAIVERAFGRTLDLPRVAGPAEVVGETATGVKVGPGTGDNMAAALGLQVEPGDVVLSLGTSGVVMTSSRTPTADPTGIVAGFADATGGFLPLICTLNGARVLEATARLLGTDLTRLSDLALAAPSGASGLSLIPYLDGERTPSLPDASGSLVGLRRDNMTPANLARAAFEGLLCGLADGLDGLTRQGAVVRRILLVGGGARSAALRAIAPTVFACPVVAPPPNEYVALGAARQAAWARSGELPLWEREDEDCVGTDDPRDPAVRQRYAEARGALYGV